MHLSLRTERKSQPAKRRRLNGLIGATSTPMNQDGSLNLGVVPATLDFLRN